MSERLFGAEEDAMGNDSDNATIQALGLELLTEDSVWQALEVDLNRKLNAPIVFGASGNPWHPCRIVLGDDTLNGKVRLRGDTPENYHFGLAHASFRINLSDGQVLPLEGRNGVRKFSLIRAYHENGWYGIHYYGFMRQQGILANDIRLVQGKGGRLEKSWLLQEAFDDALFEDLGRPAGFMLRFANDCTEEDGHFNPSGFPPLESYASRHLDDPGLYQKMEALRHIGSANLSDSAFTAFFDLPLWGRFAAINDLFYGHHSVDCHNLRVFYNQESGLLEPIAWDPGSYRFLPYAAPLQFMSWYRNRSPIYARLHHNTVFLAAYTQALQELTHGHALQEFLQPSPAAVLPPISEAGIALTAWDPQQIFDTQRHLQQQFHLTEALHVEARYDANRGQVQLKIYNGRSLPYLVGSAVMDDATHTIDQVIGQGETLWFDFVGTPDASTVDLYYKLPNASEWSWTQALLRDEFAFSADTTNR